jgi:hypothetical protein
MGQQLNRLALLLTAETRDITQRWAAESARNKLWAQCTFPQACQTLLTSAASCHQIAAGEAEAAAGVPQAVLVPRASGGAEMSAPSTSSAGALQPGSGPGSGHSTDVPAVLRYQRALPAAAASGTTSIEHRAGGDVAASQILPSSRGGLHINLLGSPAPVGSSSSAPAGISSSPGLRGRGGPAAGGSGTPVKWRHNLTVGPSKAGPEPQLGAVLKAACLLDPLAPLRCPARLVMTVHGGCGLHYSTGWGTIHASRSP